MSPAPQIFYAGENFPLPVVETLRLPGRDVITAVEAGQANQRVPDRDVLVFVSIFAGADTGLATGGISGTLRP